jgi:hypothetical protein
MQKTFPGARTSSSAACAPFDGARISLGASGFNAKPPSRNISDSLNSFFSLRLRALAPLRFSF